MLTVNIPTTLTGRNLFSTGSTLSNGDAFPLNLGTGPIMVTGESIVTRPGSFSQGTEDLYEENSVNHKKKDGEITLVSTKQMRIKPHRIDLGETQELLINNRWSAVGGTVCGVGEKTWTMHKGNTAIAGVSCSGTTWAAYFHSGGSARNWDGTCYSDYSVVTLTYSKDYTRWIADSFSGRAYSTSEEQAIKDAVGKMYSALSALDDFVPPLGGGSTKDITKVNSLNRDHVNFAMRMNTRAKKAPSDLDSQAEYGKLGLEAVKGINAFDFNGMLFATETANIKSLIPKKSDLLMLKKGKLKGFANMYLLIRFGIKLQLRDTKRLIETLPSFLESARDVSEKKTRLRAMGHRTLLDEDEEPWKITQGVRALVDTYPEHIGRVGKAMDVLFSLDVLPTTQNIWDMIPYSFVVDWLIPISDILDNIDTNLRRSSFKFHVVTLSYKAVHDAKLTSTPHVIVSGRLQDVHYRRSVSRSFPTIGILDSVKGQESSNGGVRRFIDGTSLIIQRAL